MTLLLLAYKNRGTHEGSKLGEGLVNKKMGASILQPKMS